MRIFNLWLAAGLITILLPMSVANANEDVSKFKACQACHGTNGEGSEKIGAPRLNGLPAWYLMNQLKKFQDGHRGFQTDDKSGRLMAKAVKTLDSEDAVVDTVLEIGALPDIPRTPPSFAGNGKSGRTIYARYCTFCHGAKGEGRPEISAPPLAQQAPWYLVKQLNDFITGKRGTHPKDETGQTMRSMISALPDENAVQSVVIHISSLR